MVILSFARDFDLKPPFFSVLYIIVLTVIDKFIMVAINITKSLTYCLKDFVLLSFRCFD